MALPPSLASGNGSSTPPASPPSSTTPATPAVSSETSPSSTKNSPQLPEITALKTQEAPPFGESIVTADLESLITPEGQNIVYMASWYNGNISNILDISTFDYNTNNMLQAFWEDLLQNNKGRTCYFHNFGGYDAILSMPIIVNKGRGLIKL